MSELPKGWVLSSLCNVADIQSGVGFPKKYQGNISGMYPVYKVGDVSRGYLNQSGVLSVAENYVSEETAFEMKGKIFPEGSVLFAKIGEALKLNRRGIVAREGLADNNVMGVVAKDCGSTRYLYRFLQSYNIAALSRSTTVPSIRKTDVEEVLLPIPPLNEQIRIADKLDSILAKVDQAKARLEKIPTILKRFRQSVLVAATSGELTREWREDNGLSLSLWENTIFSELSREITVGFVGKMSDKYKESGVKFLRSQNVRAFRFDPKNLLFISSEFHKNIYKSRLEAGDLAVVRSGAPGTTCVIPESLGEANCSDLVIVRPNHKLIPEFGCIFMNSSIAQKNVKDNQVGVAQQHFNVGSMKVMPISLPPRTEQTEIIRRVESLFALADVTEKNYLGSRARVNKLTQSILAKAFRGELVEQDPNDEHASQLLERIKQQQLGAPKPVRKPRKTNKKVNKEVKVIPAVVETSQSQSEILSLLQKSNSELTAQQIMDKLTEQTFEQVDVLFTDLKRLLDHHAITKAGTGDRCTFKVAKK